MILKQVGELIINKIHLQEKNIQLKDDTIIYTGSELTPEFIISDNEYVLIKDKDYNVEYSNNIDAGTAIIKVNGKGNYTGTITKNFIIKKADIEVAPSENIFTYDKNKHGITFNIITEIEEPTIKYSNNEKEFELDESPEYINVGVYKIYYKISAKNYNDYIGTAELNIEAKDIKDTILDNKELILKYNGNSIEPKINITDGEETLIEDKDYIMTYNDNINVGTALIDIKGIGNYKGNVEKTFTIEKADPKFEIPTGMITVNGRKLKDVKLPERICLG